MATNKVQYAHVRLLESSAFGFSRNGVSGCYSYETPLWGIMERSDPPASG